MLKCWHANPQQRLTFEELVHVIDSLMTAEAVSTCNQALLFHAFKNKMLLYTVCQSVNRQRESVYDSAYKNRKTFSVPIFLALGFQIFKNAKFRFQLSTIQWDPDFTIVDLTINILCPGKCYL